MLNESYVLGPLCFWQCFHIAAEGITGIACCTASQLAEIVLLIIGGGDSIYNEIPSAVILLNLVDHVKKISCRAFDLGGFD